MTQERKNGVIRFSYQRFRLRVGLCGLPVLAWIGVSRLLVDAFSSPWLYWLAGAAVTITLMTLFYKGTAHLPLFLGTGTFEKTDAGYILTVGKAHAIREVQRVCAWKSRLYGMELWFLQIEAEKTIRIASKPLTDEQTFVSVDLYKVYRQILKDHPELNPERDASGEEIPYFYSK